MISPENVFGMAGEGARLLAERLGPLPRVAVVLGSGWDELLGPYRGSHYVAFEEIAGFGKPGAAGHEGMIYRVDTGGGGLLVQSGRLHCYEGYSALDVSFPVFVYAAAGLKALVLLSAAGGLNPTYLPGDLMVVSDHIYLFGENPLTGLADSGTRSVHVNLAGIYGQEWQRVLKEALPAGTRCETGVYAYVRGPSYETDSEARLLRVAGADAVGMSSIPEVIAASYLGLDVAFMCCISNTVLPSRSPEAEHRLVLSVVRKRAASLGNFLLELSLRASALLEGKGNPARPRDTRIQSD